MRVVDGMWWRIDGSLMSAVNQELVIKVSKLNDMSDLRTDEEEDIV